MSGGRFDYADSHLKNEIFGYDVDEKKIPNVFEDKVISELVYDTLDLIHEYDWYASGDTDREDYRKAVRKFKTKWFKEHEKTERKIIDKAIDQLREELYETFDIRDVPSYKP